MKRLSIFLLLMAIGLPWAAQAQTVTIGEGTSTHHSAPIANYYNYSLAEMLFTSAEIGTTDVNTILSIGFEGANSSAKTYGITVYMKNVDVQSFTAATDYIQVSANDVVFTGSLKPATGWNTITLDTPFAYDNTKSLLVVVNKTSGGYDSSTQIWKYTSTSSTYKMLYSQNDSSPGVYDPTGSPSLSLNYERPNVQLTFGVPPTCFQPQNLQATLTPGSGTIATLTWNRHVSGTENAWVLQYGEDNTFATGSYTELTTGFTVATVDGVTTVTANLSSLTAEHTYYARVKPDCDTDGTLWSEVLKFKPTNAIPQTVCDGTTTNGFVPVYGNYAENYNKDEFIIPATTEGMANMASGTIKGMTFYLATPAADLWGDALYRVFMKEVNESSFESNSYYGTDGATIVYEGALDGTQSTMTIEFTTDYEYNGGNLLVGVYEYTKGTYKSCSFYGITSTNGALYKNNSTSLESITSGSMQDFIPKTTFTYLPSNTPKPRNLEVSNITSSGATLTWLAPANGTPTSYEYQYKLATDQWPATWTSNDINLSVPLNSLTASRLYDFRVRANYTGGNSKPVETQFTTLDDCAFPTSFAATLISGVGTMATFSWTKGFSEDDDWVLQYGTDNTFATCTEITEGFNVSGNTVTFAATTGITPEVLHYARVKTDCGGGSSSSWSNVAEFLPTNFVDYTYNSGATSSTSYHPFYGSYTTSATNQSQFVIPAAELTEIAGGTIRSITYYTSSTTLTTNWGGVILDVYMAEVDNSTFSTATFIDWETLNNVYTGTVSLSNGMMTIAFDQNYTYNGGNLLIGFKTNTEGTTTQNVSWTASSRSSEYNVVYQYSNNSASRTYYFPKVTFSYQPTPYKYPVINEANCTYTTTSAHIAWTVTGATPPPTGYQYQFKTAEGEWPTSWSSTTNAYADLSSLTHSTYYDFRVKALYDGGYESIAVNYRFATECDAITTFPVTYGFETTEGFPDNASAPTTNQLGACWRNEATVQTGSYATRVWGTSTSYKHDGSQALVLPDKGSGCRTMLVFPAMDFTSSSGYIVSFWIYRNSTGSNPEGFKMYISDCDTIGPNAVELGHYSRNYSIAYPVVESTSAWYQYETEPITMTGTVYLIFEGQSYYGSATYVDDITIEAAPTCWQPQNLAASNVTNEAATLTWERNTYGHETEWVLQYGEDNTFATGSYTELTNGFTVATVGDVTTVTANLSMLTAEHTYYARVKPACDTEGNLWSDVIDFTTLSNCAAPYELNTTEVTIESAKLNWTGSQTSYNVRYRKLVAGEEVTTTEDFSGQTAVGYSSTDGELPTGWYSYTTGTYAPRVSNSTLYTFITALTTNYLLMTTSSTGQSAYAIMPQYSDITEMSFNYAFESDSNCGNLEVGYVTDNTGYSTFTRVGEPITPSTGSHSYTLSSSDIATINRNNGYIAFKYNSNSSTYYSVAIDDVVVTTQSFTPDGAWNTSNTNVTSGLTISSLTQNTMYEWQVQGINSGCDDGEGNNGVTAWSESAFFTTTFIRHFATTGEWNVANSWVPAGLPEAGEDVIIDAAATIPANYLANVGHVTLGTNGAITIADGGQLRHTNAHTSEDVITVTLEKVINAYEAQNTKSGYYLIAPAPFFNTISPNSVENLKSNTYDFYSFSASAEDGLEWINLHNSTSSLKSAHGYLYANSGDGENASVTLRSTGKANSINGGASVQANHYDQNYEFNGWNLAGNPYVCNAYVYVESNNSIIATDFYLMNDDGDGYDMISSTDPIKPYEGVFVYTETSGTIRFSVDPVESSNNSKLNMNLSHNGRRIDMARVRFGEGQNLAKMSFLENSSQLYIPQNGKDYAMVYSEGSGTLPVCFKAENNGTYTLSFTNEEMSFAYLHLIDNMTGIETDLLANPSYSFDAKTTDYESRFKLVFATGNNANDDTFAFYSNGSFVINNEGEATLQVIDVNGRVLKNESINGCANVNVKAAAGVYMLRLVNGNDVKVQKVVVR